MAPVKYENKEYTGVSVSKLFGYRDPPLVICYPNKFYPNCSDTKTPRPPCLDTETPRYQNKGLGIRTGVKKLPKPESYYMVFDGLSMESSKTFAEPV